MGTNVRTYILIGAQIPLDWDRLPSDDEDGDDWHERWKEFIIYDPKPGDYVIFSDMDHAHYQYFGKVIDHFNDKWDRASFNESFDVLRLKHEITEVTYYLNDYGVFSNIKLHIISNAC